MTWETIETAPKDGSSVLLSVEYTDINCKTRYTFISQFDTEFHDHPKGYRAEGCWMKSDEEAIGFGEPTHWMPLPEYVPPTFV